MLTLDLIEPPRRPFTPVQGKCSTTWSTRYENPHCPCEPVSDEALGPCATFARGATGTCVYCDHTRPCHDAILKPFGPALAGFIGGAGTWTRDSVKAGRLVGAYAEPRWYEHGSRFAHLMHERYGVYRVDRNGDVTTPDPPLWDGSLEGTTAHILRAKMLGETPLQKWIVQSRAVGRAIRRVPNNVRWVLVFAHSHFGQVAATAIGNLTFRVDLQRVIFITIDTPNRRGSSMQRIYDRAAENIGGRWIHLHSGADWGSRMRWLGARCLPWQRQQFRQAAVNIAVDDEQDHSGVVRDMDTRDVVIWDKAMHAAADLARAA